MPLEVKMSGKLVTYQMTFGFLPPSKNVYDNWQPAWKSSAKKKWIRHVGEQCEALQIPKDQKRVGLAAMLVFAKGARRDPQNYAQALWNWVPDALVQCGVLIDDADGCIEIGRNWGLEMAVDRRPVGEKKPRTVITLACLVSQ